MKKTIKKSLSVVLSMVTLISSFVFTGFAEDKEYDIGNGVVVESYICENDDCDFNWTLYENELKYYQCIYCGSEKTVITGKATGHKDENNDGYCDICNENISPEKTAPANATSRALPASSGKS